MKQLKIELDEKNKRSKTIKDITNKIRTNDVKVAQLISSITELEKFNTQLETEMKSFQEGGVGKSDEDKLKNLKESLDKIKDNEIEPDFVSAIKLCKRRRIGPLRPQANRELYYKKDMGILARGGFNYELSKRVLDLDANEFNKFLKIV